MTLFDHFLTSLEQWKNSSQKTLFIQGPQTQHWPFLFSEWQRKASALAPHAATKKAHLFLCSSMEEAESFYLQLKALPDSDIYLFPGWDISPFSGALPSESNLLQRFNILDKILYAEKSFCVVTTFEAFLLKLPPREFFLQHALDINVSDVMAPDELAQKLVSLGYIYSPSMETPGSFCQKGEVFDIYPISSPPVRLHYFDELIEEIFLIDLNTQKTLRNSPLNHVHIAPSSGVLKSESFTKNLKSKLPMPPTQFRAKFETRKNIFRQLSEGELFEGYPYFVPLFFEKNAALTDYFPAQQTVVSIMQGKSMLDYSLLFLQNLQNDYLEQQEDVLNHSVVPAVSELYWEDFAALLRSHQHLYLGPQMESAEKSEGQELTLPLESAKNYFLKNLPVTHNKFDFIKNVLQHIQEEFAYNGHVLISSRTDNSQKELNYLFEGQKFPQHLLERIQFIHFPIEEGFFYADKKILLISDADLFSKKKAKAKRTYAKKVDLFAEQLATLRPGDYVVHNSYGIGEYQGLETLFIGGLKSDFLVLHYEDRDKVYVPVYKMNYIQKFADAGASVQVSSLKSKKFELMKERAKKSAKLLAFDLLKLQAERQSSVSFAFSPPDHLYNEFELAFPFEETPDQLSAAEDVLRDMQASRPMDRLVCGDVGFGKTEVAMRAAFKAILDKKQVAILVPTTILAMQHYNSFVSRFKDFPVVIEFLSRFKTATEAKKILQDLKEGKIDIVIGTHKLLSKEVGFSDLGLVIIDEEQRFGVAHKEKLKLLKSSVDFLTLTATPIPRTLQLAYLGVRDLSLIQTAPPKRQSIKSFVVKKDKKVIQQAIEKELERGGQVFFVHNRVQDIESIAFEVKQLVPLAKVVVAHGQMAEKELEKRIRSFYMGESNVLVSTTIIEAGLDIPSANTMIVNRAHTFGLSQLHQLRGRIGRSDKKAYAYFIIPQEKPLSSEANQRLVALQTYSDMGQGFSIASADLEIRGAGDILGGEQSGHIDCIGLELYTELLNEAIAELKGEKIVQKVDMEVFINEPAFIPHEYMRDPGERLKYYKKFSNCTSLEYLEELKTEVIDIFGPLPEELNSLLLVLEVRTVLQKSGIKSIKVQQDKIHLKFAKEVVDANEHLQKALVEIFMKRPKIYKFNPDYSVVYSHKAVVTQKDLVGFSKLIAEQIVPC